MTKRTTLLFFFLISINLTIGQNKTNRLDSLMTEYYKSGAFNGNILVAENGKVIYQNSFGLANEETNEKLNQNSVFYIASLTKAFTATGIVLLEKKGELEYDDEITKYIPELHFYKNITIRHLLTHTSGLPDYMELFENNWNHKKMAVDEDVVTELARLKPEILFEPGEKFRYSNTGYILLATIIEKISNQSFGEFLKKNIFNPLKMNDTKVFMRYKSKETPQNLTVGYMKDSLGIFFRPITLDKYALAYYLGGVSGDGGIFSTTEDLLKWDRALYGNELISEEDKKMIFTSHKTNNGENTDYGFGWFLTEINEVYGKIAFHSGGWNGYITYIERELENDKTIILLQNHSTDKTTIPKKEIRKILYNEPIYHKTELDSTILKLYAGTYITNSDKEKIIIYEKGKLFVQTDPEFKMELIPVSNTKFIVNGFHPEVTFEFILDNNGRVEKYKVQQLGQNVNAEANRID